MNSMSCKVAKKHVIEIIILYLIYNDLQIFTTHFLGVVCDSPFTALTTPDQLSEDLYHDFHL